MGFKLWLTLNFRACSAFLFLDGPTQASFHLFLVFLNKQYNFYNKSMQKMSIQYMVPGFKPTTFQTWVITHKH